MRSNDELPSLHGAGVSWNSAECVCLRIFQQGRESDGPPPSVLQTERDPADLMPLKSDLCMEESQFNSCEHPVLKQQRCSVTRSEGYAKHA